MLNIFGRAVRYPQLPPPSSSQSHPIGFRFIATARAYARQAPAIYSPPDDVGRGAVYSAEEERELEDFLDRDLPAHVAERLASQPHQASSMENERPQQEPIFPKRRRMDIVYTQQMDRLVGMAPRESHDQHSSEITRTEDHEDGNPSGSELPSGEPDRDTSPNQSELPYIKISSTRPHPKSPSHPPESPLQNEPEPGHPKHSKRKSPATKSISSTTTRPASPPTHLDMFPWVALTLSCHIVGLPPSLVQAVYSVGFRYHLQTILRRRCHKLTCQLRRIRSIVSVQYISGKTFKEIKKRKRQAWQRQQIRMNAEERGAVQEFFEQGDDLKTLSQPRRPRR